MELKQDQTPKVDPARQHYRPATNIMIRARHPDGTVKPADLATLDKPSLKRWLMADVKRMRNTILVMLKHAPDHDEDV
jgi:hypothetical protein